LLILPRFLASFLNVLFFILNIFILGFSGNVVFAPDAVEELQVKGKSLRVARVNSASILDGELDDAVWQEADLITDFCQSRSGDHAQASELTKLYVIYAAHRRHRWRPTN